MQYTIEVTEDEYKTIMELRSKKQDENQVKALNLLHLSKSYLQWLRTNGAEDTYSTFCNDFGYESEKGEDRPTTHKDVMSVIRHAYELIA